MWRAGESFWEVRHEEAIIGDWGGETEANCNANLLNAPPLEHGVTLADCLWAIRRFNGNFPRHHVITLWLELRNEAWKNAHEMAQFNELLVGILGSMLVTQDEIRGDFNTLREAVLNQDPEMRGGWPTLGELQGRIIVVLFTHHTSNSLVAAYQKEMQNSNPNAPAFIAAKMYGNDADGTPDAPHGIDQPHQQAERGNVIFYSLNGNSYADHSYGPAIFAKNRVSSTFYVDSDNTPGVSEYRDFLIQHGRWGEGINDESLNSSDQYSGRLLPEVGEKYVLPVVARIKSSQESSRCLEMQTLAGESDPTLNGSPAALVNCTKDTDPAAWPLSQTFAIIDVAVDVIGPFAFPQSRAYMIHSLVGSDTTKPNEGILEVRGAPPSNTADGIQVFQWRRERTAERDRSDDQYWWVDPLSGDFNIMFRNHNSDSYLNWDDLDQSPMLKQDMTPEGTWHWELEDAMR